MIAGNAHRTALFHALHPQGAKHPVLAARQPLVKHLLEVANVADVADAGDARRFLYAFIVADAETDPVPELQMRVLAVDE